MATDQEMLDKIQRLQDEQLLQAIETQERDQPRTTGEAVGDVARSVVQGATFNLGDEAVAGLVTATRGGTFGENLAAQQERLEEIPLGTQIAGGVAGGVATGTLIAKLFPAAFATLRAGAGTAAAEGAVAGFGAGRTAEERARGAAIGFATGGTLGAVLPKTAEGVARMWDIASTRLMPRATQRAGALILRQFQRGEISMNQVKARLAKLGREAILADIPELRGLADRVAQSGGIGARRAQRILTNRAKKSGARIVDEAGDILGKRKPFQQTMEELITERAALSGPLYDKAYQTTIELTDDLQDVGNRLAKVAPTALKNAERSLAAELGTDVSDQTLSAIRGGTATFARPPGVQYWDLVKRELDDMIGGAVRGGASNRARQLTAIKDQIVKSVDDQTDGAYAAARQAFLGPKKMEEALEAGRTFVRGDADEIVSGIKTMTEGEKEMFRLGVVKGIQDITENRTLTSDQTRRLFDTDRSNRIFKEIFPNTRELRRFKRVIFREKEFAETNRILRGSQTFARQTQADQDETGAVVELLTTGGQESLVRRAVGALTGGRGLSSAVGDEVSQALFAPGASPEAALGRLGAVPRAGTTARALGAGGALGAATGVTIPE